MGPYLDKPAFPVDIGRYHQVFVFCDFYKPLNVGYTKAPLLRSFQLFDSREKLSTIENANSFTGSFHQVFDSSQKQF